MDTTRAEQIALDDALVAPVNRIKIGKSNIRLRLDLKSKEATLQVAIAKVHCHSIRFKMNSKKHIVNLEYFEQMLQICPKLPDQQFEELPFEEEILMFLRDLGHSGEIKVITDVNVNKLHQPWRSFAAVINKCLSGKSIGYDSLRLSQAQILWGMYHKKNVDYAYLLREDFVYQVENKNVKRSNEMYYPRFTKVIVNFFMTKDQSIPRRNKVNWHFARDDPMFTTIKVVSRHEDTQLYGAILPIDLTNEAIKDSESYKEYYAIALGAEPPKTKASAKKKQVESDKAKTPLATKGKKLKTTAKEEQMRIVTKRSLTEFHSSHASGSSSDEDDAAESENDDDNDDADNQDDDGQEYDEQDDEEQGDDDEQTDSDNDGDDFVHALTVFHQHRKKNKEEDSFDPRSTTEFILCPIMLLCSNMPQPSPDTDKFRDETQAENEDFINKLDDNIKKIIKDQVKAQVSKILPKIKKTVNEQLKAEVLTRSSNESQTSHAISANLSELELKKILIDKIESNKSVHISNEQKNLYKALVDAYKSDKLILDTYGETISFKRH
ncbi:copia protein [Tanacetum coccineum]|uniref:Copia protein n=1 Tax=Tanacetum coccineum TaxID=301880 RepID=A0ABQ5DEL3_9ASTR